MNKSETCGEEENCFEGGRNKTKTLTLLLKDKCYLESNEKILSVDCNCILGLLRLHQMDKVSKV